MAYFHNGDGIDHLSRAKALGGQAKAASASKPGALVKLPSGSTVRLRAQHQLSDDDWDELAQATSPDHPVDHDRLADVLVPLRELPDGINNHRQLPEEDRQVLSRSCESAAHRYLEHRAAAVPAAQEKTLKARAFATTAANTFDPELQKAAGMLASQEWTEAFRLVSVQTEVDWLEKRSHAKAEDAKFAAECHAKAAKLRAASEATTDPVLSRELLFGAVQLEQDAVHGRAVAERREAEAKSRERAIEKRAIESWERF